MTKYQCDHCHTIWSELSSAMTCCASVSEVEECPKCGGPYENYEYPCCYVGKDKREENPDKEMWDKWDKENT